MSATLEKEQTPQALANNQELRCPHCGHFIAEIEGDGRFDGTLRLRCSQRQCRQWVRVPVCVKGTEEAPVPARFRPIR